jgi:PAS domain S-box-containing protein
MSSTRAAGLAHPPDHQAMAEASHVTKPLEDSEVASRLILDSIPALVVVMTPAGEVEHVNRQVRDYFGKTLDEMKNWRTNDAVHPDDRLTVFETFGKSISTGDPYEVEHRLLRFDGEYRWFQARGVPVRDRGGPVARWYVLLADIEDRKRAEDALRESQDSLRKIIDTLPVTAWSTRPDGYCDFLNRRWLDYAGFSAEQAEGWGWGSVIHPDDAPGLVEHWQARLASGAAVDFEARMRRADGVYRWFLFRANPLRDEAGNIVKWYGTNVDIEDRKRADEELRASELNARLIVDCIPAQVAVLAPTGEVKQINRRMSEFFGSIEALADWKTGNIVPPDELPRVLSGMGKAFAAAQPFEMENHLRRFDGVYRWFQIRGLPLLDSNGLVIRWYFLIADIEERKQAEAALDKTRSELARVTRSMSLGTLTASIAHEVNQPLSGIVTNATTCVRQLSADPPNVDGALKTAGRLIRDAKRAADVVTRLRALFGKKAAAPEAVDLNDAVLEVISLVSSDLQRSRVIVQAELDDEPLLVNGDRVQLQQVILNLVRNASDAMNGIEDRPKHLLIRTQRDAGDHVRLTVQDVGTGLDPADLDRLFDAFYTTKNDGMGIGLSVSQSIIERHSGRLWATSNEGPGATFAFSIPCRSEDSKAAPAT